MWYDLFVMGFNVFRLLGNAGKIIMCIHLVYLFQSPLFWRDWNYLLVLGFLSHFCMLVRLYHAIIKREGFAIGWKTFPLLIPVILSSRSLTFSPISPSLYSCEPNVLNSKGEPWQFGYNLKQFNISRQNYLLVVLFHIFFKVSETEF